MEEKNDEEIIFTTLTSDLSKYGETIREDLSILLKRYPFSHGQNLQSLLSKSNEELGKLFQENPVISQIQFS